MAHETAVWGQERLLNSLLFTNGFRVQGFSWNSKISLQLSWYILRLSLLRGVHELWAIQGLGSPSLQVVLVKFLLSSFCGLDCLLSPKKEEKDQ